MYFCVFRCNIPPNFTLAVLLPVNDVIERDRLSVGVKIYLLLKLGGEIHCLQMIQQLYERGEKSTEKRTTGQKNDAKTQKFYEK